MARARREREEAAPPLADEVPTLDSLRFQIEEQREESIIPGASYAKVVPVANAHAHFEVPCHDERCDDGGHDLTTDVLRALRNGHTEFDGTHQCPGSVGDAPCQRTLSWEARAEFAEAAE